MPVGGALLARAEHCPDARLDGLACWQAHSEPRINGVMWKTCFCSLAPPWVSISHWTPPVAGRMMAAWLCR